MTDLSFNDSNSPTEKESQVPLFARMPRSSNDESSTSSHSPVNLKSITSPVLTSTDIGKDPPRSMKTKERSSFYSSLAFTDDTMFNTSTEDRLKTNKIQKTNSENQSNSSISSCINDKRLFTILCQFCGQCHEKDLPHLYDYSQPVDVNLLCVVRDLFRSVRRS